MIAASREGAAAGGELEMKHIAVKWPHFHLPEQAQRTWIYAALIAAVVLAALVALGWYAGVGGFGEWGLFQE